MTTHYRGTWKRRAGNSPVPYCMEYAFTPKHGRTTTEKSEVDCVRCAKSLGITPAAKAEKTTPRGTCPCCFNNQAIKGTAARIVLHGYKRPGHGYIIGNCFGVDYPMFERSCEGTIALRARLSEILEDVTGRLANAAADRIESLGFTYDVLADPDPVTGKYRRDAYGRRLTRPEHVTVAKGTAAVERESYAPDARPRIPAFAELLAKLVRKLEGDRDGLTADIAHLTEKIDGWKPAE